MAVIRYEDWFAREYHDVASLNTEVRSMREKLLGRTLDSVRENRKLGILCCGFGNIKLLLWYPDVTRVKTRLDGRDILDWAFDDDQSRFDALIGRKLVAMFAIPDVFMSPGATALYLEGEDDIVSLKVVPGKGTKLTGGVSVEGRYAVLSEERIPMTHGSYAKKLCDMNTGEIRTGITDGRGVTIIRADYNDIQLGDAVRGIYRTVRDKKTSSGDIVTLYGACDDSGREIIPCKYSDLYCMANGCFLVMDADGRWWALDDTDRAIYGPSVYGVDIYGTSPDYLFVVEYNDEAGFECLGIYDVAMMTVTCGAVFSKLKYIGDERFAATLVEPDGRRIAMTVDKFGNELTL